MILQVSLNEISNATPPFAIACKASMEIFFSAQVVASWS